jgi:hypothetical protein
VFLLTVLPVWRCVQASKKEETFSEQLRVLTAKCKEVSRVFFSFTSCQFFGSGMFFPPDSDFFPDPTLKKRKETI